MNDFELQVASLRPQLMRFARSQLRNETWAEDAVSETLLAAVEKPDSFAGRSRLATWLIGILRHKIIDQLRRNRVEVFAASVDDEDDFECTLFQQDGHWQDEPQYWANPEAVLEQREFFEVLEACCDHLPPVQGRVFLMREWLGLETEEICRELAITRANLWVLLHRARLRLQLCLQARWFSESMPQGSELGHDVLPECTP
jgi:RNA polymerase sigma-70 factor (ECF subfamily)